jgi:hypothetical protein
MEAYHKSQIVTFKYYVGVIHFLDENYVEVCIAHSGLRWAKLILDRRKNI